MIPILVPMTVAADSEEFSMTVGTGNVAIPMSVGAEVTVNYPLFDGEYSYTPSSEVQTIPIVGKAARQDITINPIPQNYGLISRIGAILTVS